VLFRMQTVVIVPARRERFRIGLRLTKSGIEPVERFPLDDLETDPLDPRRSPGKVTVHEDGIQTHRFEDLGAAIAAERGNTHLGHHLQQAFLDSRNIIFDGRLQGQSF